MRRKGSVDMAIRAVTSMLSGAALRASIGLADLGEVLVAKIGDDSDAGVDVDSNKRDAWVKFTDVLSGLSGVGRLLAPGGILWRAPAKGDGAHVVMGRKMRGPGGPLVIPDGGDGNTQNVVPDWFPDDAGLFDPSKNLHIESKKDTVTIKVGNAVITVDNNSGIAITAPSGQKVTVNGSTFSMLKTETLLADFATNWNLLVGVLNAGTQGTPVAQTLTGLAAVLAQLQQFGTNLAGATYKSTNAQNG